jgi:hypothetical protein
MKCQSSFVAPRLPPLINPLWIGFRVRNQKAISTFERMVAVDGESTVNTGCEAKIRFRWMQAGGLRRSEILRMRQDCNADGLAVDVSR